MRSFIPREACEPYSLGHPGTSLQQMLERLTRDELEDLAARFYGREPGRFEELLLEIWARREAVSR